MKELTCTFSERSQKGKTENICNSRPSSPCITCVQYRRSVQYSGGYLEYCGDIMMHVEDILSTVEAVQYRGEYHEYRGGYHDARGGHHEYCGGVQ